MFLFHFTLIINPVSPPTPPFSSLCPLITPFLSIGQNCILTSGPKESLLTLALSSINEDIKINIPNS